MNREEALKRLSWIIPGDVVSEEDYEAIEMAEEALNDQEEENEK